MFFLIASLKPAFPVMCTTSPGASIMRMKYATKEKSVSAMPCVCLRVQSKCHENVKSCVIIRLAQIALIFCDGFTKDGRMQRHKFKLCSYKLHILYIYTAY